VCNPAIKTPEDQKAIWRGLLNGKIDIIATDHAPHTLSEKAMEYPKCPSGVPLIQHSLLMMLEKLDEIFTIEVLVDKMCHAPATCFNIKERGYLREGYYADIAIILPNFPTKVTQNSLAYKCKWSPFEGFSFRNSIEYTLVNGAIMQKNYKISNYLNSQRVEFQ
jgi:dihydroorotase